MPDPLTVPVLRVIRTALIDRRLDNDRAISGRHTTEPAEHDKCCEYHLVARFVRPGNPESPYDLIVRREVGPWTEVEP